MSKFNIETCPGIKSLLRPTMKYIKCPDCGDDIEIWSDETETKCLSCGKLYQIPEEGASCLVYCDYADQCKEIIKERGK